MKQKYFFILLIVWLLSGCTNKIDEPQTIPADLIPKEQMVDIVVDLRLMDAVLTSKQRKKEQDMHFTQYYLHNSIMEKYGITRDQFERSFQYYQQNMKLLDEIYEEAITKLTKLKTEEIQN